MKQLTSSSSLNVSKPSKLILKFDSIQGLLLRSYSLPIDQHKHAYCCNVFLSCISFFSCKGESAPGDAQESICTGSFLIKLYFVYFTFFLVIYKKKTINMDPGAEIFKNQSVPFKMNIRGTVNGKKVVMTGQGSGEAKTGEMRGKWVCSEPDVCPMSYAALQPTFGYGYR